MIKESVKSASTIEDAKAAALLELGLTEDDVYNIEVLQMPQKKTFGIRLHGVRTQSGIRS